MYRLADIASINSCSPPRHEGVYDSKRLYQKGIYSQRVGVDAYQGLDLIPYRGRSKGFRRCSQNNLKAEKECIHGLSEYKQTCKGYAT